ncbi:MAG: sigma-54-dependent Fis family transcriptional regulator [Planctomycetota bacterium]
MSEAARARAELVGGEPALALGICEAALAHEQEPAARVGLATTAAEAARALADLPAQIAALELAERDAQAAGLEVLGSVLLLLADAHLRAGDPARALVTLSDAREQLQDDAPRARHAALLAEAQAREGDVDEPDPAPPAAEPSEREGPWRDRLLPLLESLLDSESDLALEPLLELILSELVRALGADRGFVLLREPSEALAIYAARDRRGAPVPEPAREVSRKIAERAATEARPLRAVRPAEDPRFADSRSARALDLVAVVAGPLRYRNIDLGCVVLDRRRSGERGFSAEDEALVAEFVRLASGQIVRTRRREAERHRTLALEGLLATRTAQLVERLDTEGFVGQCEASYALLRDIERMAATPARVLIRGESGVGKEGVARLLHRNSDRRARPFVAINCAAVADTLLEAELFGNVRGAFTGADRDRPGLFERANGGTLFLDEVGDASPRLQGELLRVLETQEVRRVGGSDVRPVDVRVLAATHQDLEGMVAEGRFREDLLYRLNVLQLRVPSLAERRADIPELVRHFAAKVYDDAPGAELHPIKDETVEYLASQPWPGNVRQLRNAVLSYLHLGHFGEASAPAAEAPTATPSGLPASLPGADQDVPTLDEAIRRAIVRALRYTGGNQTHAAKVLGIGRRTLYNKLRAYGLE